MEDIFVINIPWMIHFPNSYIIIKIYLVKYQTAWFLKRQNSCSDTIMWKKSSPAKKIVENWYFRIWYDLGQRKKWFGQHMIRQIIYTLSKRWELQSLDNATVYLQVYNLHLLLLKVKVYFVFNEKKSFSLGTISQELYSWSWEN